MRKFTLADALRRFGRDEQGATIVYIAVSLLTLIIAVGSAIDLGRVQLVRMKAQSALDAAAVSAGAFADEDTNLRQTARRYFRANYPVRYMRSRMQPATVTKNADSTVLNFAITGQVSTVFMGIVGIDTLPVSASSEVTRLRDEKILELSLVLDTTGSMGQAGKIDQLKQALHVMTDLVYGEESTLDNIAVSLVPYAAVVNVGTGRTDWLRNPPLSGWAGCVRTRDALAPNDRDQPPVSGNPDTLFEPYYFHAGVSGSDEECPASAISPMLHAKAQIDSAVDALTTAGSTRTNIGLQWGWRTLSPAWRGRWVAGESLPRNFGENGVEKVLVLMTDGDNTNTSFSNEAADNADQAALCTAMKQQGIIIYTIGFDITDPLVDAAEVRALLQGCATQPNYYFEAATGNELVNAFRTIADALKSLRLSQ